MKAVFNVDILLPLGLLLLQTIFFFFLCLFLLQRMKIIKKPLAGLEYSNVIVAAAIMFGMFYITTADIQGLFQAYKTYQNQQGDWAGNTFSKFSQLFLVIFFLVTLFGIIAFGIIRLLLGFKNSVREIQEGNITASILMAVIIIGTAVLLQRTGEEVMTYLTPQFVNFR